MKHLGRKNATMEKKPLISIIVPFREDRGYLKECKESINNQTFNDFEVIYEQSDANQSVNVNNAVRKAQGEYIKIVHEDDTLPFDSLEKYARNMDGSDILVGAAMNFNHISGDKFTYNSFYNGYDSFISRNTIHGGGIMFKKSLFKERGYNEDLNTAEEYEFMMHSLLNGAKMNIFSEVVYNYRMHAKQKSIGDLSEEQKQERKKVIKDIQEYYKLKS